MSWNAHFKLIQLYYAHRAYLTPKCIARIFEGTSSECPRCGPEVATFIHMVWDCPALTQYWETVVQTINVATDRTLTCAPMLGILGQHERNKKYKVTSRYIDLALILAWHQITFGLGIYDRA